MTSRTVLVTGSTSGIGLGLAEHYARTGAAVLLTGRSPDRLRRAAARVPRSTPIHGDLSDPDDRESLAAEIRKLGRLDVLVNNAGMQRRVAIAEDNGDWPSRQREIDLLLGAPIHLGHLLAPLLLEAPAGQVVNVTSGGALTPQPFAPTYSAAKAALRSYTANLRLAFEQTTVAVTELLPPAVATGLTGDLPAHGADVDDFCDTVFPLLEQRRPEVGFGPTDTPEVRARLDEDRRRFLASADRFPVGTYAH